MVEGIKPGSGGGPAQVVRGGARPPEEPFSVGGQMAPSAQKARLSSLTGLDLDSMLALQTVEEQSEHDRAAGRRGKAMIAVLTKLQRATLAGEDPVPALRELDGLVADDLPWPDDPALGAILRAIALRSRLELARREQNGLL
jgi:hypothetical protein